MYTVFTEGRKVSPESPMAKFNLVQFANEPTAHNFTLIEYRINFIGLKKIKEKNPNEKIVYIDVEEPNRYNSSDPAFRREIFENDFYKILSICPYTTEWLNKKQNNNKRTAIFYPFDPQYIPAPTEKKFDVMYVGNIFSQELENTAKIISHFNYGLIADYCFSAEVTHKNVSFQEKLNLVAQSKISIVHNILSFRKDQITNVQRTPDFRSNKAFAQIPDPHILSWLTNKFSKKEYLVPQLKTRMFESAFSKSLILCRKDPWNEIERYFVPDKEFVYYEPDKLEEKITEILADYDKYVPIIENAYTKAINNYTSRHFFEKYLKNLA
jgi:hypothetical protein